MIEAIEKKIRAAMLLQEGAKTEAEAAAAAAAIERLCAKHNIDIGSVQLEKEETEATLANWDRAGQFQAHWAYLGNAVCKLLDVSYYRSKRMVPVFLDGKLMGNTEGVRIVFFGLKANVASAQISFEYLLASVEAMMRGWASETQERVGQAEMRSFRLGCSERIFHEAEKQKAQIRAQIQAGVNAQEENAIVLVGNKLIEAHKKKMNLRKGSGFAGAKSSTARQAGYAAGGRVDLHGARTSRMLA